MPEVRVVRDTGRQPVHASREEGGMTPFYVCSNGHDEVRWAWVAGPNCWYCRREGLPAHALVIESNLMRVDDELSDGIAVRV